MADIGKVIPAEIVQEMQKSYLDYAMSVIVARALPDVRDGLKPVHRRILYAMHLMGLRPESAFTKSAKVVGEVLGKYHPHGDMPVYDALVRLAQDFSMRYPLVRGQGNFGSVDGDPPAAMRYCVGGDTLVITDKGLDRIEDLKLRNPHIHVLSWNNKIKNASKWFDSGVQPTIKIETYRGYSLKGSTNHPILTWGVDGAGTPSLAWKMLAGIKEGDWAVINRKSTFFPKDPSLAKYYPEIKDRKTEKHLLPKTMSSELAFLLGSLIAEGSIGKSHIDFTNTDKEYLKKFKEYFKTVFPDTKLHEFKRKPQGFTKKSYYNLEIHSKQVREFLRALGLTALRANQKDIPEIIYNCSKKSLASFLLGYSEGDGSVYLSGAPEISLISKSKKLLANIQTLLLRFGIECSVRYQPSKDIYKLLIRGHTNLNIFAQDIGFISRKKIKKLEKVSKMNENGWVMSRTDFIPFILDYLRNSDKYYGHLEWLKKHNFNRLPKLKKAWPKLAKFLDKKDLKMFKEILDNGFLFDKVVKIENTPPEKVYSLAVESNDHSFITNGFISHNTEVKLAPISTLMLTDIEKETVEFMDNFDATLKEPNFLPALLPNLLLMGSEGIAVGMATKIPPHNLSEVVDAIIATIKKGKILVEDQKKEKEDFDFAIKKINLVAAGEEKDLDIEGVRSKNVSFESDISVEELVEIIPGPDFPTYGAIYGGRGLAEVYSTGRGRIVVRGIAEIVEGKKGRSQIIISEIPYQVNKAELVKRIAELVHDKKITGISDLRDESDKDGLRVAIDLKRDARAKAVLNNLYKHTKLQTTFPANFVALVEGVPHTLGLKQILVEYIKHRQNVITRRTLYELAEAKRRAHILEGLKIALDNLDEVIKTIRKSRTQEDAKNNLVKKFGLSAIQATAILDMQLRRLAALEREKIEKEYQEVKRLIDKLVAILKNPEEVLKIIVKEVTELSDKFGDARRTKIYKKDIEEFSEEDLVPKKKTLITVTRTGYIKRVPITTYKTQARGGKGVAGMTIKVEDEIEHLISATTHDMILFFTNKGKVYGNRAWDIPETTRQAKGQAIVNILDIGSDERIMSILPMQNHSKHLVMVTSVGIVKKTSLAEFQSIRSSGLIAIRLDPKDQLVSVHETGGDDHILIITKKGKSIRFPEGNVRSMGRATTGMRGIKLEAGDEVIGMEVFSKAEAKISDKRKKMFRDILTIAEKGMGKRTPIHLFPIQKRSGKGVKVAVVNNKTGVLAAETFVTEKTNQVVITSKHGQIIKLPVKNIPSMGRSTQGVILMRFAKSGDGVAAITTLDKEIEAETTN